MTDDQRTPASSLPLLDARAWLIGEALLQAWAYDQQAGPDDIEDGDAGV